MIDRRSFVAATLAGRAAPTTLLSMASRPLRAADRAAFPPELERALERSEFVYVSPLRASGAESRCHGEVWYGWLDGGVVLITGKSTWKARSLRRGLDRARIWVGDHGRWKQFFGHNEKFREAPHFDARAEAVRDRKLLDGLLALYETKYPEEIADWRVRMRDGYESGDRVLIRYRPLPAGS